MTRSTKFVAAAAASLALPGSLAAQAPAAAAPAATPAPAPPPCSGPEYRQLDFWVGTWIAEWETGGVKGTGRNVVTRDEYGSCVITERFTADDKSLVGHSISTFYQQAGEWRQTWMDAQGGYFDLFGGPNLEPTARFGLQQFRRAPDSPWRRMIWQDVTPDSFTWRWQSKTAEETPWQDQWVIRYRRAS